MGIRKNIVVDGMEVSFKASATVPRLYRMKFGRDIFKDFSALQKSVKPKNEDNSASKESMKSENEENSTSNEAVKSENEDNFEFDIESLETFENIAYIMARHADPENVPDNPDDWLERFNTFSIYEILPQLLDLWGMNNETQSVAKKNIDRLTAR
ncbi:MAG: hypothetical protein NC177_07440 [Ruminococcus flavefaciens]|nr:hypothetical protein [Ruminococcus flavefaciens]